MRPRRVALTPYNTPPPFGSHLQARRAQAASWPPSAYSLTLAWMSSFWAAVLIMRNLPGGLLSPGLHPCRTKAGVYTEFAVIWALQSEHLATHKDCWPRYFPERPGRCVRRRWTEPRKAQWKLNFALQEHRPRAGPSHAAAAHRLVLPVLQGSSSHAVSVWADWAESHPVRAHCSTPKDH